MAAAAALLVVSLGQSVLALCKSKAKGLPKWVQCIWLGKVHSSDQHICLTVGGKLILTRSVRQMQPSYDPRLHDVVKDRPYDHPGFLAGSVGRSKPQKAREVQEPKFKGAI